MQNQKVRQDTGLIFFKYFNIERVEMSFVGTAHFLPSDSCEKLFEIAMGLSDMPACPHFVLFVEAGPASLQPIDGRGTMKSVWPLRYRPIFHDSV